MKGLLFSPSESPPASRSPTRSPRRPRASSSSTTSTRRPESSATRSSRATRPRGRAASSRRRSPRRSPTAAAPGPAPTPAGGRRFAASRIRPPGTPVQTADIHRRWLDLLRRPRAHRRALRFARERRPDPAVHGRRHGAVHPVPDRRRAGAVPARHERAEVHPHERHRRGRQDPPPRHVLPDERQLLVRRLLQGRRIAYAWELLTSSESATAASASTRRTSGSPSTRKTTRRARSGRASPGSRTTASSASARTNYWSTGQPGPAGPCSEIFFDRGPAYGIDGGPATDDDRYVEIWNLVFMQYLIQDVRSKIDFEIVGELPKKNIDTGMGMERVAFLKQGVENMYEIDQVRPVLDRAAALSGKKYGADHDDDVRMRVIADHVRSGLMLMTDGVTPGNEGRGYILRRLLRRAIRSMRLLGVDAPSLRGTVRRASARPCATPYPDVEDELGPHVAPRARRGGDVPAARSRAARRSSTPPSPKTQEEGRARRCPATRRSCCTTPSASRST